MLKDCIYTIGRGENEYQAILTDDLFTLLETKLHDRNISGSQELQDLLENDEGYIPMDDLEKLCEVHQIVEDTFSADEQIDYKDFKVRSRRILNRISLYTRILNMERGYTIH